MIPEVEILWEIKRVPFIFSVAKRGKVGLSKGDKIKLQDKVIHQLVPGVRFDKENYLFFELDIKDRFNKIDLYFLPLNSNWRKGLCTKRIELDYYDLNEKVWKKLPFSSFNNRIGMPVIDEIKEGIYETKSGLVSLYERRYELIDTNKLRIKISSLDYSDELTELVLYQIKRVYVQEFRINFVRDIEKELKPVSGSFSFIDENRDYSVVKEKVDVGGMIYVSIRKNPFEELKPYGVYEVLKVSEDIESKIVNVEFSDYLERMKKQMIDLDTEISFGTDIKKILEYLLLLCGVHSDFIHIDDLGDLKIFIVEASDISTIFKNLVTACGNVVLYFCNKGHLYIRNRNEVIPKVFEFYPFDTYTEATDFTQIKDGYIEQLDSRNQLVVRDFSKEELGIPYGVIPHRGYYGVGEVVEEGAVRYWKVPGTGLLTIAVYPPPPPAWSASVPVSGYIVKLGDLISFFASNMEIEFKDATTSFEVGFCGRVFIQEKGWSLVEMYYRWIYFPDKGYANRELKVWLDGSYVGENISEYRPKVSYVKKVKFGFGVESFAKAYYFNCVEFNDSGINEGLMVSVPSRHWITDIDICYYGFSSINIKKLQTLSAYLTYYKPYYIYGLWKSKVIDLGNVGGWEYLKTVSDKPEVLVYIITKDTPDIGLNDKKYLVKDGIIPVLKRYVRIIVCFYSIVPNFVRRMTLVYSTKATGLEGFSNVVSILPKNLRYSLTGKVEDIATLTNVVEVGINDWTVEDKVLASMVGEIFLQEDEERKFFFRLNHNDKNFQKLFINDIEIPKGVVVYPNMIVTYKDYWLGAFVKIKAREDLVLKKLEIKGKEYRLDRKCDIIEMNEESIKKYGQKIEKVINPYIQTYAMARNIVRKLFTNLCNPILQVSDYSDLDFNPDISFSTLVKVEDRVTNIIFDVELDSLEQYIRVGSTRYETQANLRVINWEKLAKRYGQFWGTTDWWWGSDGLGMDFWWGGSY